MPKELKRLVSMVTSSMVGKHVICTDCTAVRDYVTDEVNGLLVKNGLRCSYIDKVVTALVTNNKVSRE